MNCHCYPQLTSPHVSLSTLSSSSLECRLRLNPVELRTRRGGAGRLRVGRGCGGVGQRWLARAAPRSQRLQATKQRRTAGSRGQCLAIAGVGPSRSSRSPAAPPFHRPHRAKCPSRSARPRLAPSPAAPHTRGRIEATYAGWVRRPGWRLHDGFRGGWAGGTALLWIGAPRVVDGGVRIGRPARTTAATSHGTTQAVAWIGKVGVARGDAPSGRRGSVNGGRSAVAG